MQKLLFGYFMMQRCSLIEMTKIKKVSNCNYCGTIIVRGGSLFVDSVGNP